MAAEVEPRAAMQKHWLERLEPQIDLPAWLQSRGFDIAQGNTDPTRIAMTNSALEVYHLPEGSRSGTWTYVNTANPTDRGTIVDFMVRHEGATLATSVDRLAGCLTSGQLTAEGIAYQRHARQRGDAMDRLVSEHLVAIEAERSAMPAARAHGCEPRQLRRVAFWRRPFGRRRRCSSEGPTSARAQSLSVDGPPGCSPSSARSTPWPRAAPPPSTLTSTPATTRAATASADRPPPRRSTGRDEGRPRSRPDRRGDTLAADLAKLTPALHLERQKPELGGRWADQMPARTSTPAIGCAAVESSDDALMSSGAARTSDLRYR